MLHSTSALPSIFQVIQINFTLGNLKSICYRPSKSFNFALYSEASATGWGAHLNVNGDDPLCHKQCDVEERRKSPTKRELSPNLFVLQSFLPLLKRSNMNWFSQSRHWQNYTAFPRKCNVFLCSLFYDLKTLLRRNARSS